MEPPIHWESLNSLIGREMEAHPGAVVKVIPYHKGMWSYYLSFIDKKSKEEVGHIPLAGVIVPKGGDDENSR